MLRGERPVRVPGPRRWMFLCALLLLVAAEAEAQQIPRDQYLRYMPLEEPRLIRQTETSAAFDLYGDPDDPGYIDVAPRDGIDDRRADVFMRLGVRFAPFMVLNTTNVPLDPRIVYQGHETVPLNVDTWKIGRAHV